MYETRIIDGRAELAQVRRAWEALIEQRAHGASGAKKPHLYHDPRWLDAQLAEKASENARAVLVALFHARDAGAQSELPQRPSLVTPYGTLAGVAPLLVRDWAWRARLGYTSVANFPVSLATLCGQEPLVPDDEAALDAFVSALGRASSAAQLVFIESLDVSSPLAKRFEAAAREPGARFWLHRSGGTSTHRLVRVPGSFKEYADKWSGRTRRTLAYKWRKLEAASAERRGKLSVKRYRLPGEVAELISHAERVSSKSWQGTRLGKVIAEERQGRTIRAYAENGWLRSYVLLSGDAPLAFVIGYQAYGTYIYDVPAYDPAWAAHNPGSALLYRMLEDLTSEDRPEVVDFGYGDNEYKRLFSTDAYEETNVYLVQKSAYTGLARATHEAAAVLGSAARSGLDRLGLRERVRHLLRGRATRDAEA